MDVNKKQEIKERISQALDEKNQKGGKQYAKSLENLIEDLKIYQVELEFQNDELRRIQNELEQSRNQYRELFQDAPVSYAIINKDFKIIRYNHLFFDIFQPKIIHQSSFDFRKLIHPNYQDKFHIFFQQLQSNGKNRLPVLKFVSSSGKIYYMNIQGTSGNLDGNFGEYFQLSLTDITDQVIAEKELLKSQKRLNSVLQSQKELICRFNRDTTLTYVNAAYINEFIDDYNEMMGKKWIDNVDVNKRSEIKKGLKFLINSPEKEEFEYVQRSMRKDGKLRWYKWTNYAIKDNKGRFLEFQSVGNDITDQIEKQQLEKEIEITKSTLRFKQNFLASMSHEMRTPLTAIVGITELLKNTQLDKLQVDYVQTIEQSSFNLGTVIDEVLDYSNLEAGKVTLKINNYRISKLVEEITEYFNTICHKPIAFECHVDEQLPDIIRFDYKRVMQVLKNLVINAVKFSSKGNVKLSIEQLKRADNQINIQMSVADTGIGIKPEMIDKLFSPFSQVHEIDTATYSGIGLGLAFCQELVKLHGGDITIDSEVDRGTTVKFDFKAQLSEKTTKPLPGISKPGTVKELKNLDILLVEDKKVTQKVISLLLTDMGHNVVVANHGKEAIEIYEKKHIDLILMDIQMPVMDGITATKTLKEKYDKLPPIVGLSANAFEGDREKYMHMGMDEYLTKPVRREDFKRVLRNEGLVKKISIED